MATEKEKMIRGEMYIPTDPELIKERLVARQKIKEFNNSPADDIGKRKDLWQGLFGQAGDNLWIEPPFYCDYGYNIYTGENVFINFNCTILDVMPVYIGNEVMIAPNVQLYSATHPLDWKERSSGKEYAKGIKIGSYVWIGGGAIICPGVTIGDRTVIGAGSVVTKDIPPDVVAAGNPCRVIKQLK